MAERAGDGGVDGEERPDGDERDLRSLADLQPQDEERDPGQRRDRPDRPEGRAEEPCPTSGRARSARRASKPERGADGEADEDALGRDQRRSRRAVPRSASSMAASRTTPGRRQLDDREHTRARSSPATATRRIAAGRTETAQDDRAPAPRGAGPATGRRARDRVAVGRPGRGPGRPPTVDRDRVTRSDPDPRASTNVALMQRAERRVDRRPGS